MNNTKQVWVIVAVVVIVAAAAIIAFRVVRGDSKAAADRAQAVSTPQGVAKLYEGNEHMPAQAKAAAAAAAAAHGATMGGK